MLTNGRWFILALCLLATAAATRGSPPPRRGSPHDAWHRLIAEYTRAAAVGDHDSWGYPFSLGSSPVLLLPIPIPVPAHHHSKSYCADSGEHGDDDAGAGDLPQSFVRSSSSAQEYTGVPPRHTDEPTQPIAERVHHPAEPFRRPTVTPYRPELSFDYESPSYDLPQLEPVTSAELIELYRAQTPTAPQLPPALIQPEYRVPQPAGPSDRGYSDRGYRPPAPATGYSYPAPATGYSYPAPATGYSYPAPSARFARQTPPAAPPRYPRSLMLKGEVTAYKADYTEPYTAWMDGSGASRVDFHGGAASAYRVMRSDGGVQHVLMRTSRSADGAASRRCMTASAPAQRAPPAAPALPDLGGFLFGGFKRMPDGGRAEVWRRGERAAVGGEGRTMRHEVTLMRQPDDTAVPVSYSVTTDSDTLGPDSDRFEHRYMEVRPGDVPPGMLDIDVESSCSEVVAMNASDSMQMSLLDPLQEFLGAPAATAVAAADALHLDFFTKFSKDFGRKYKDKAEEVLRMNVLTQSWRWLQSANRMGATFEVGVNFLADRLDVELAALRGVLAAPERRPAERFPHAAREAQALAAELPARFDWRERGAVTPPRYQGSCSSCWAFAVTAATEGALAAVSGRLVPLSEQVLVDCGNRTGAHGCSGTWPSFAYDYVQETGLPANGDYTPYAEKVLKCRDDEVPIVTRISAHVNVTSESIPALKVAIRKHAPSVVIIDATTKSFIFYKKGILYDDRCGKSRGQLNHAVTAVGWGIGATGDTHFTAKNSWSDKWGEAGFVRLQADANTCGVLTLPSYPRLEAADVVQPDAAAGVAAPPPADGQ